MEKVYCMQVKCGGFSDEPCIQDIQCLEHRRAESHFLHSTRGFCGNCTFTCTYGNQVLRQCHNATFPADIRSAFHQQDWRTNFARKEYYRDNQGFRTYSWQSRN